MEGGRFLHVNYGRNIVDVDQQGQRDACVEQHKVNFQIETLANWDVDTSHDLKCKCSLCMPRSMDQHSNLAGKPCDLNFGDPSTGFVRMMLP